MRGNIIPLIKSCCTQTVPAAERESIVLQAGGTATQLNRRAVRRNLRRICAHSLNLIAI
jgi:hypothetical protein